MNNVIVNSPNFHQNVQFVKTITNVESQYRILDVEIAQSPLPEPYNNWRCIISCNDCGGKVIPCIMY